MEIVELENYWLMTGEDLQVEILRFDWAVTISIGTASFMMDIRISQSFALVESGAAPVALVPEDDPVKLTLVLKLLRQRVAQVKSFKDGGLEIEFMNGSLLKVGNSVDFEPWEIVGPETKLDSFIHPWALRQAHENLRGFGSFSSQVVNSLCGRQLADVDPLIV